MVSGEVRQVQDNSKKLDEVLKQLTLNVVLVGVPEEKADRTYSLGDGAKPMTNAEIGYLNEFGSPASNIPARPHLLPTIKAHRSKIVSLLKLAGQSAMKGDKPGMIRGLSMVGIYTSQAVKKKITDGVQPKLADATIAARKAKGFSGETPLLVTAQYLNSITWVIHNKSGIKTNPKDSQKVQLDWENSNESAPS